MSDLQSTTNIPGTTIDVRELAPMYRHQRIFETYNSLKPGENFLLVNDHDPKPLYYQFQAEHAGQFTWNYVECCYWKNQLIVRLPLLQLWTERVEF